MFVSRTYAPVRQQTLSNLRNAIVNGQFKPGERLLEKRLCGLTGVSRTSIREALRQLEAEGLVKIIPNKGPIVATLSIEEARDIYEVRQVMEGLASRLFAERATSSQIKALVHSINLYEKACYEGDKKKLIHAKNRIYDIVLKGSGNKIVHSFIMSLHARITFLRSTSLSQPGRPLESLLEIKRIMEAFKHRDPEAAWVASTNHVSKAEAVALRILKRIKEEHNQSQIKRFSTNLLGGEALEGIK